MRVPRFIDSTNLLQQRIEVTPVTVALSPKEIKVIKCNGVGSCKKKKQMYSLPPDYLSHIVVIGKSLTFIFPNNDPFH